MDESDENRTRFSRRQVLQVAAGVGVGTLGVLGSTDTVAAGAGAVRWSFSTSGRLDSSPTIVNGTVFVGSNDENLYAVAADDGSEQWRFGTGSHIPSSPTVVDGTVFVGTEDGYVYAVDAANGEEEWRFETDGTVESPTVVNGRVFVGGYDNDVYALDTRDGSEQWRTKMDNGSTSPTAVADAVFVGSSKRNVSAGGRVSALDAHTGKKLWRFETGLGVHAAPTVANGTVYAGSGELESSGHLYALDAYDGSELWRFENNVGFSSTPTVADGAVFIGSLGSTLHAVDADPSAPVGTRQWEFFAEDNGMDSGIYAAPTVADGTVFFGNNAGFVYALDTETGDQQWQFQAGDEIDSAPTVVDGTVFVGSGNGTLYALDAGVAGSSSDSRVLLGTFGHHENRRIPPVEVAATSNNTALKVGGAAGLVGAGYLARRRYKSRTDEN